MRVWAGRGKGRDTEGNRWAWRGDEAQGKPEIEDEIDEAHQMKGCLRDNARMQKYLLPLREREKKVMKTEGNAVC